MGEFTDVLNFIRLAAEACMIYQLIVLSSIVERLLKELGQK